MTTAEKPKLWPESFRLLRSSFQDWALYALLFTLLLIPAEAWQIKESGPYNQKVDAVYQDFFNALGGDDPMGAYMTAQEKIDAIPSPSPFADVIPYVLSIVALYFIYIRLLEASTVLDAPKLSVGGFGNMLLKLVQKYVIVIVPPVFLGSLCGLILAVPLSPVAEAVLCIIPLTAAVIIGGYFFCRYTTALPMALSGIKGSLKKSGTLAAGNIWRLASGYAVITTILLPPMLVIPLTPILAGAPNIPLLLGLAVLVALCQMAVALLFAAFGCTAFAILYSEKKAADSAFSLAR